MRRLPLAILALGLLPSSGCSDLALAPTREPAQLRFSQDTVVIQEGGSTAFRVTVLDREGRPFERLPGWLQPVWTVSDPQKVRMEGESLQALKPGQATAQVSVAGLTGRAVVRVNPREMVLRVQSAYLTQSIQRPDGSIPLVAGREALLRVFVVGDRVNFFRPRVRVHLFSNGSLLRTLNLSPGSHAVPERMIEGELAQSWNVLIAGPLIQPGLSLVVEADPDRVVPLAGGSQLRLPAEGALALDVRQVPKLWLRVVPVVQTVFNSVGQVNDSNLATYVEQLLAKFPLAEVDVQLRAPYTTSARLDTNQGWSQLLSEINALRRAEGSLRYYYGIHKNPPGSPWGGLGYVGWPAAIGHDALPGAMETLAHELGHNFSLLHAPCGNPSGIDVQFPHAGGGIRYFGFDLVNRTIRDPGTEKDLMSYCSPRWISDYSYLKSLNFRAARDPGGTGAEEAPRVPGLLVWGGVQQGRLVLEPAFELDMPAALPEGVGPYRLQGLDAGGQVLFSYSFSGHAVDHAPGERSFSFAIPASIAQPERLSTLRVTGPEGEVRVDRSAPAVRPGPLTVRPEGRSLALSWSDETRPMALIRDARTGEILSFARDGVARIPALGRELEVLLSDGVRTTRRTVSAF